MALYIRDAVISDEYGIVIARIQNMRVEDGVLKIMEIAKLKHSGRSIRRVIRKLDNTYKKIFNMEGD